MASSPRGTGRPSPSRSTADAVGHPFAFPGATFRALRSLHGDKAVWKLADRAERIGIDRPLPLDVDTWDDYVEVCNTLGVAPQLQSVT